MEITQVKVYPVHEDKLKAFVSIVFDHFSVFPANTLRRQYDWSQWVLDLMRNPARHIGPGTRALRRNQLANIIDRYYRADIPFARFLPRH